MSKRTLELFLFDIFIAILKIEHVANQFEDDEALKYNFICWDSVIREFEIIGEATNVLIKNQMIDEIYRVIVDFRNKIIHHYFGIDSQAVWNIIKFDLEDFQLHVRMKIKTIEPNLHKELMDSFLEEYSRHDFIIERLTEL